MQGPAPFPVSGLSNPPDAHQVSPFLPVLVGLRGCDVELWCFLGVWAPGLFTSLWRPMLNKATGKKHRFSLFS